MSAVLIGVKYKSDKRDQYLHHGGWLVKLALWLGFCILPFFFPVGLVNAYCEYCCLLCIAYFRRAMPTSYMYVSNLLTCLHGVIYLVSTILMCTWTSTCCCSLAGKIWVWLVHGGANDHPAGHDTKLE